MPNVGLYFRSFTGGEVSPELYGRIDDAKFQTALARCRNFIAAPHGPAINRAGTKFVREVKDSNKQVRLIKFSYSTDQTMALEIGENYIRFHTQGQTLLVDNPPDWSAATAYTIGDVVKLGSANYYAIAAGTNHSPPDPDFWYLIPSDAYEVPTDYDEADLFDIHYVQSADVLTLVHPNYPPRELRREGATGQKWALKDIVFASLLAKPTGVVATPHVTGSNLVEQKYVVTAVGQEIADEGPPSDPADCDNNLFAVGSYNDVTWSAVTGAQRYNVYKLDNGLYGFIGQTPDLTFRDDNITPDLSQTPPEGTNPFDSPGNYPGAVSYFEQRRAFAGTLNRPQNLWMTRSGTESILTYSIPTRDDDAIAFRVAAREANTIRHLVPLNNLLLLTSAAEWRLTPAGSDVLTPSSVSIRPQSYVGASNVQPEIVNNNVVYAVARGGHMREMAYSNESNGYLTGDLCLRAAHLFDGYEIRDMAQSKSPLPIVWAISSSGQLLGITYVPEQSVGGWHWHDTEDGAGVFESVTAVAEGAEDAVYLVVRRTINGQSKRYIERMEHRYRDGENPASAFFVDCGLTYDGPPADEISGLGHLEGKEVNILADGSVRPRQTVTGGKITLDEEASLVHVGLMIRGQVKTLPVAYETASYAQGKRKNVNSVHLRVVASGGIFAGPTFDKLKEAKLRKDEPFGSPPRLQTGIVEIKLTPTWDDDGQVCIEQTDPLPLTLAAMAVEVAAGGS